MANSTEKPLILTIWSPTCNRKAHAKSQKVVSLIPLARCVCQSDTYLETLEEGVRVDFDVRHKKAGAVLAAASDAETKTVGRRPSLELDISGLVGRVWHQKIVLHLLIQWHDAPVNTETHIIIVFRNLNFNS